ncbi:hypothetical protein EV361DRAFT_869422 [Lentinula raphanica]|nr:hypothetical protein EV361DRAFT_869422 [Lentinula raphanica]
MFTDQFTLIPVGSPVEADEYWTLALLPLVDTSSSARTEFSGLRTHQIVVEGELKWERDDTQVKRGKARTERRLPAVLVARPYEELGRVWLSRPGRQYVKGKLNQVAPSINLFYFRTEFKTMGKAITYLEGKSGTKNVFGAKLDSEKWDTFFASMVKVRGSGAGFAITEKDHPEEWKLYVQAEKDLAKKEAEKKEQEEKKVLDA